MNWYKIAQRFGYHGTDTTKIPKIKLTGLKSGQFFAGNEDDCSPYSDGVLLRFPFPQNFQERIGRGEYYTTLENIPPQLIEIKLGPWGNWEKI